MPAALGAPEWDVVPGGIADALCQRLQSDRFADSLVMVKITQPIVTSRALSALYPMKRRPLEITPPPTRAIPVDTMGGCAWRAIDVADRARYADSVVVELSSPLINPAKTKEAGLFARVTIGGAREWYWIAMRSRGGAWELAGISPIGVN
ncbi:MAG TPA: hypothetical protein VF787_02445 [Thermoanaerobaculia bacterium]